MTILVMKDLQKLKVDFDGRKNLYVQVGQTSLIGGLMSKIYKVGFYGGKFMPLHKGHNYCIQKAAEQCEKVYVILFYGGDDEIEILKTSSEEYLSYEFRMNRLKEIARQYDNVEISSIDVTSLKLPDGSEDWDAETPLVLNITGHMDAVYSSEPGYDNYFKRAYPWAVHILVDPPRVVYPISGTKIRNMKEEGEKKKWMI